jgi:ATP-dependent RNA helicase HrpB
MAPHVRDVARRLAEMARDALDGPVPPALKLRRDWPRRSAEPAGEDVGFLRAIFAGYPDRVARRRAPGSPKFLLASGHGAVLGRESGVRDAEFIVAVDVQGARLRQGHGEAGSVQAAEATIRMASAIDTAWLSPGEDGSSGHGLHGLHGTRVDHDFDSASGRVRAVERRLYGEIVVAERPAGLDPEVTARLLAEAYRARGWSEADTQLLRRLRFAEIEIDIDGLLLAAAAGHRAIADIDLGNALDWKIGQDLNRFAPETLAVPSGRTTRLQYQEDGGVVASVKLQELFGLAESPRLGPRRQPVVFELLAPNGRPVQTTRDLRSFWDTTYQEVRKELRGRYPRHPWPEDPWTAPPTARTTKRKI